MNYGKELILDMHDVKNTKLFTRKGIKRFMIELCDIIDMEREDLHFWDELYTPKKDRFTEEHLIGTSAVQFITTSNITIHTLDKMKRVYLNIFSCKNFKKKDVRDFCQKYFDGKVINCNTVKRV